MSRDKIGWLSQIGFGLLLLLGMALTAWADDSAISGDGGSIQPLKEHTSIAMVKEKVVIDLFPTKAVVDCLFTFHNTGPATTVKMGFPESGHDPGLEEFPQGFAHFASWVDGQEIPTHIETAEKPREGSWERWRVKTVAFAADQTRLVRVRYDGDIGVFSTGDRLFSYILSTGASWKGPIGDVLVITQLYNFPWYYRPSVDPAGFEKIGNAYTWHWQNLEPKISGSDSPGIEDISFYFYPGYRSIVLNGEGLGVVNWQGLYCQLENRQVIAPLGALAEWIEGTLAWEAKTGRATLIAGKHKIALQANQAQAELDGRPVTLKTPPKLRVGRLYISANEIIELLGGTSRFDKPSGISYFTFGAPPEKSLD